MPPQVDSTPKPTENNHLANVWVDQNRVSSDNQVKEIELSYIEDEKEPIGKWAKIDSPKFKLNGVFKWEPFVRPDSYVTNYGFDQIQVYNALTSFAVYLGNLGFSAEEIIGESKNKRFVAHVDAVDDMNAWFSPQSEELTFGTSNGQWNLGSDNNISGHEGGGHFVLHRRNKRLSGWYNGEGNSIHEGYSDYAVAAHDVDPEMSEDFPPAMGKPEDKNNGLRTVDNDLKLSDVEDEEHEKGKVYGGFPWSLQERLMIPDGQYRLGARSAANTMATVMTNHATFYRTNRPKSADFVRAIIDGTEALAHEGKLGEIPWDSFKKDIIEEAIKREMIKDASEVEEKPKTEEQIKVLASLSGDHVLELYNKLSPRTVFEKAETSNAIGGSRTAYDEYYITSDGRRAQVLGSGFFIHYDSKGGIKDILSDDIRLLRDADVDENIKVNEGKAIELVRIKAREKLVGAQRERDKTAELFMKDKDKYSARMSRAQMEHRIALAATEKAGQITEKDARLVVLPGEKGLYYEFQMGLSLYYVNVNSKKVKVEKDVLWDRIEVGL